MSANLTYRSSSAPTIPGSTTVKNSPLTNLEMDANLKALADDIGASISAERSAAATLTNKTINGSSNTISNISLTSSVTGTLPVANGGTGVTSSTGSGANVLATGPSIGLVNATGLPLATGVSGILPVANGGTGQNNGVPLNTAVTGVLAVANGGTGGNDKATARAGIDAAEIGNNSSITNLAASTTIGGSRVIGYRDVPQTSFSSALTLALTDASTHLLHPSADTTARTLTIPANAAVAFPIGTAITIVNQNAAGVLTIAITSDTMRLAGAGTTGSRTLAANGLATLLKIGSTEWIISGAGLT